MGEIDLWVKAGYFRRSEAVFDYVLQRSLLVAQLTDYRVDSPLAKLSEFLDSGFWFLVVGSARITARPLRFEVAWRTTIECRTPNRSDPFGIHLSV